MEDSVFYRGEERGERGGENGAKEEEGGGVEEEKEKKKWRSGGDLGNDTKNMIFRKGLL